MGVMPTTTEFSPEARYLPLWTFTGRRQPTGRMHLARVKTTTQPVTLSWCGRRLYVDPTVRTITGEDAVICSFDDEQPTCQLCLARAGAWRSEW